MEPWRQPVNNIAPVFPGGTGQALQLLLGNIDVVDTGTSDVIIPGPGNSTIGGGQSDTITGGTGTQLICGSQGEASITGDSSGSETIYGGAGDTITAGQGQIQIGMGGGAETFNDTTGVYADTISGFSQPSGDRMHLTTDTVTDALAHATEVNGGQDTLITLSDGSTVLLKGVSSINSSFFS